MVSLTHLNIAVYQILQHSLRRTIGGLLVDLGMLTLKPYALQNENKADSPDDLPNFEVFSQTVIEWRALTVVIL